MFDMLYYELSMDIKGQATAKLGSIEFNNKILLLSI